MRLLPILSLFLPLVLWSVFAQGSGPGPAPFLVIFNSQSGQFHSEVAKTSRKSLVAQWKAMVPPSLMKPPKILLTSQMDPEIAEYAWTIFPLVEIMMIHLEAEPGIDWVTILNENTELDLQNLNHLVHKKMSLKPREKSLFFGRGLQDSEPTIVHHFSQDKILYPDLEAGIFLSRKLVLDLWKLMSSATPEKPNENFPSDFNIDPAYEFAKFLSKEMDVVLEDVPEICTQKTSGCVSFSRNDYSCVTKTDTSTMKEILSNTLVAVKTCTRFHEDRVKAVLETWAPLVTNLMLVSDTVAEVGTEGKMKTKTTVLEYTINTESGHCNKTLAILQNFLTQDQFQFLVIVDDDTILSVARLVQMLACFSPEAEDGSFILGQRYGYKAAMKTGYSYITGGGGMILTRQAVAKLLAPPNPVSCPAPNSPDDMQLGIWAKGKQVSLLHSGRMFQARPPDYPDTILTSRDPVSFHKHWEISPYKVYDGYFRKSDKVLLGLKDEL